MIKPPMQRSFTFTRDELYGLVWAKPLNALAVEFGISANALAKICDRLMVPHPARGVWSRTGERNVTPTPLPPSPSPAAERVVISAERAPSRRARTRKSREVRREQISAAAADLARAEGLNAVSMKRLAQVAGVSEALVYNYFSNPTELLVELARVEVADMEASQEEAMSEHTDYSDRARASASSYLRYVARRGGLLQILLGSPEVRSSLRMEYRERRIWSGRSMASNISANYDLDLKLAELGTTILRSAPLRAGKLLAAGKLDLDTAEGMTRALADGARDRLVQLASRDHRAEPSRPTAPVVSA